MSNEDTPNEGTIPELTPEAFGFMDFVKSHVGVSESTPVGIAKYRLSDEDQLLPINFVEFEVFDASAFETGYLIAFAYNGTEVGRIVFDEGFGIYTVGSDWKPVDQSVATNAVSRLTELEKQGRMVRVT